MSSAAQCIREGMNQFLCLGSSSSSSRIEQSAAAATGECRVNTEAAARDASIPDLNIASTSCGEEEEEEEQQQQQPPSQQGSRKIVVAPPEWLPLGWTAEVRIRECGSKDKYYIEPSSGKKFRSKLEVLRYLETGSKRKSSSSAAAANGGGGTSGGGVGAPFGTDSAGLLSSSSRPFLDSLNNAKWPAGLDNLREIIVNGMVTPPTLPSMHHGGTTTLDSSVKLPDFWTSTLGGTGSSSSNSSSSCPSWTDHFKLNLGLGTGLMNGASSSLAGQASTTPHWLDRILNKGPPPPPPAAGAGSAAAASAAGGGSLAGGFVQSPLHYLQNAGAFQNSWLHIKPPTPQSQPFFDCSSRTPAVDGKSWSWYEDTKGKHKSDARLQDFFKRREINLNQALDPDEEDEELGDGNADPFWTPEARFASASRSLESLWEKAVPIELEHRKFVAQANGVQGGPHFHHQEQQQQHQQQHQHFAQQQQLHKAKEGIHFVDLGVKKASSHHHKVDRHQEKKRMESLGKSVCQQSLTMLLGELKDSRIRDSLKRV